MKRENSSRKRGNWRPTMNNRTPHPSEVVGYTPMRTLREVKTWAKANGLVVRSSANNTYGLTDYSLWYRQANIIRWTGRDGFILKADTLRKWHDAMFPAELRVRE